MFKLKLLMIIMLFIFYLFNKVFTRNLTLIKSVLLINFLSNFFTIRMIIFKLKLRVFKSLTKISVSNILTNNFKVNLSKRIKRKYCVPIKEFLEEFNYKSPESTVDRLSWSNCFTIFILLFNLLKCLFYMFWNEDDQLIRLYCGDLTQFLGLNTKFMSIPQAGISFYSIAIFYLIHNSSVNQLNLLKVLKSIEGKQSFVSSKIFVKKSAKTLIRLSLILIIFCTIAVYFNPMFALINFLYFSFTNLTLSQFILYSVPWAINNAVWVHLICCYYFAPLIVLIICYYYEIRLNQLDVYVNQYLKRKKFIRINQQVSKLLTEYTEIISEINELNKFSSFVIFYLLSCCSSTQMFLIYNMIYIKINWLLNLLYILFSGNVCLVIILIMMRVIRIASRFHQNKRNLIKINYVRNLSIKNRIKVKLKSYSIKK